MTAERSPSPEDPIGFEEALERLEGLVVRLEAGDQSLEEALQTFEEGVRLFRLCSDRLRSAELRVREIEEGAEGPTERDVALEEDG
jgi:exodeoxyribonuclease VII small subunit